MQSFWRTRIAWALSLGLFENAYVYGVAAVALEWIPRRSWSTTLLLLWAPLWLCVGIAGGGWTADHLGRKKLLAWGPLGYIVGASLLLLGPTLAFTLPATSLLMITAGIESNTILTYSQELVPQAHQRQAMYAELNFVNLGGLGLAALATLANIFGTRVLREAMAGTPIVLAALSMALRRGVRESTRWIESQSRRKAIPWPPDYRRRIFVAVLFSFSNTSGFSLLTFAYGSEFFPRHFQQFFLVSTVTSVLVGLLARWLVRLSAKRILLLGYGAALLSALALQRIAFPTHPAFWPILFTLSAFTSMSYLAEDTFKTDKWPSVIRSRMVAVVRILGLGGYSILLLISQHFSLHQFLGTIVLVWAVGFLGAVLWQLHNFSSPSGNRLRSR